jgi:hypothetical protein
MLILASPGAGPDEMIRAVKAIALARQLAIWTRDITTLRNVVDRIVRGNGATLTRVTLISSGIGTLSTERCLEGPKFAK